MTVLSSRDISSARTLDSFSIERESGESVDIQPSSVDLHLGESFSRMLTGSEVVDPADESTYPSMVTEDGETTLLPGDFVLAYTDERFALPDDVVGFLWGRSSIGRLGLFVHNAGLIDAGFRGDLVLELYNAGATPIKLREGMSVAQVTFHHHESRAFKGYGEKDSKYQHQQGITTSRYFDGE